MITRAIVLLSLVVIGAFDAPTGTDGKSSTSKSRMLPLVSSNCTACRIHKEIRAQSIKEIKQQILDKLGLKQPPNMTGRPLPRIPPLSKLMDIYGMQADQPQSVEPGITHHEEIDEYSAKTESVIALAQPHQGLRHSKGSLDVLYFKFSDKIVQHRVTKAELSLWVWGTGVTEGKDESVEDKEEEGDKVQDGERPESSESGEPVTITLQRILRGSTEAGGPLLGPPLTTRHLRPAGRRGAWVTIELRRMVTEWFKHPRDNLGVALKITDDVNPNNHRRNSWVVETKPGAENAPYLEVQIRELDSRRGARIKRNIGLNCDDTSRENRCCRYKLTVDFERFGWDWVIAPKTYDANYCSGDCPISFLPTYTNTHIVSLSDLPTGRGPCCAPRKVSGMMMLYFNDHHEIVHSKLPGMVVERCGCS